jgi:DNA mismatch endonuclease (patch repair protein)
MMARPLPLNAATVNRLRAVPSRDTTAELAVRAMLTQLGVRYRTRNRDLPGSPDMANRSWAIFVHGCFWHHHRGCPRAMFPKNNPQYWRGKFRANRSRDESALVALHKAGFKTLVVWECDVRRGRALRRIASFFSKRDCHLPRHRTSKPRRD